MPILDDPEYRTIGAGRGINAGEFTTVGTLRELEGDELNRAFSLLYPIFLLCLYVELSITNILLAPNRP